MQFNIIDILYYACIFPLQSVMGLVLESLFGAIKSQGLSIIFLSVLVNICLLKIYAFTDAKAKRFGTLKASCDSKIAEFKRVFKGAELQSYIRILYKQRHYHPIFALSGLGGLALQVPFFIAVLFLLQDFEGIKGESFLWISDLSAPDSVFGIHLLPILMTAISLINVWVVAKEKGARIQGIVIALIFLVLLYQMPSALVLYWTSNMAFSLIRAIVAKFKFGNSPLDKHSADSANFGHSQTSSLVSRPKFAKNYESHTAIPSIAIRIANRLQIKRKFVTTSKTKPFFIFRKPLKIAIISLTAILAIGLIITISLMLYAKDNVQIAPLSFDSYNKARIHFEKWDFLLRSSTISNVKLVDIVWDKAIDSTNIKVTKNAKRFVYFEYLDLEKGTKLGQISYTMDFTPLLKNLFIYYFAILCAILGIYLLLCIILRFQAYSESYAQTYRKITNYAILCIAFLICVFTPYQLYNTDITQFDSTQTYSTLSALFGAFMLFSFITIYAISFIPKRFSNFVAFILSVILFSGIAYSFILVGDYGALDRFVFKKVLLPFNDPTNVTKILEFIIVAILGITLVAFTLTKLMRVWQIAFATLFIVSGVNATSIVLKRVDSNKITESSVNNIDSSPTAHNDKAINTHSAPPHLPFSRELFSYSKSHKNIVVIVLDMFSGSHTPYILEQFPHFKEQLDGFTLFPNAISTSYATIHSMATLISGEHYAVYNMNMRKENLMKSIKNAYENIGLSFADNGYNVSLIEHTFGKNFITNPQLFILDEYSVFQPILIKSYNLQEKLEFYKQQVRHYEILDLISFGLFKFSPELHFKNRVYNNGNWLFAKDYNIFNIATVIDYTASAYAPTHILNTNATKPTFKFFHSMMTHSPYGMYFSGDKCEFFSDKSAWNDYSHKVKMYYPSELHKKEIFYQHFDTEACALKYLAHYVELLKNAGIYDNTQIFVVSDHSGNDNIGIPVLDEDFSCPDTLFLFKDFGAKGALKIDNRLMANYDISSIFCENLPNGCPNVPKNILKHYPENREIIHTIPKDWQLEKYQNEWPIKKAYKVKDNIYDEENWIDISDESYGIVNTTK